MAKQKSKQKEKVVRKKRTPKLIIKELAKPSVTMEDIYRLLNRVQIDRKDVTFTSTPEDAIIVTNLLKDLELPYTAEVVDNLVKMIVRPGKEIDQSEEIDVPVDFLPDEIPEDGHLF